MNSLIKFICAILMLCASVNAFSPVSSVARVSTSTIAASSTSLNVFGKRKSAAQKAEEEAKAAMYWEGEWVCKDCGYIYNRVSTVNINLSHS